MSYLANAIEQMLNEYAMTSADLSRKSGLNSAQISRLKSACQTSIKPATLVKLAAGFSKSPQTHAQLLYANLLDVRNGPGSGFITIEMQNAMLQEQPHKFKAAPLPPAIQKDLEVITSKIGRNHQVRDMIHAIAEMLRGEPLPQART